MSASKRPLLILVDGHAVAYRAYFALQGAGFRTEDGEPTNATFGFTRLIFDILDQSPDYFAISFDRGLSGRGELYPDYKGTREKMDDDLSIQMERIQEVVEAFNIPILALDGYEADDIIGTVAAQAEAQGCDVRIISGDKDILQLVSEHTVVQLPDRKTRSEKIWGLAEFAEKYAGLEPRHLPEIKGLMGDSSDNIPGVYKVGEKSALQMICDYDSIEGVYENIGAFTGKRLEYLERDRELAFLSRDLATIQLDVPIQLDLPSCVTHDYDPALVIQLFRELQFRTLSSRLRGMHDEDIEAGEPVILDEAEAIEMDVVVVDDKAKLGTLVDRLNSADMIAFDVETTGLNKMQAKLVGISLAVDGQTGYYIPLGHVPSDSVDDIEGGVKLDGRIDMTSKGKPRQMNMFGEEESTQDETGNLKQLPLATVIEALRPALTNPAIPKIAHNAKFDLIIMRRYGIDVQPITYDTMLLEWVREPGSRNLGLKNLVSDRLGKAMQEITELIGKGAKQISFARVPIIPAANYASADTAMLHRLLPKLLDQLPDESSQTLFAEIEMPLVPIIADIEMRGVLLDVDFLNELSVELEERIAETEAEVFANSGGYGEFNISSLNQLNEVLFEKLMLSTKGLKKTKTDNYSITASVLEDMRGEHPIIDHILEYRSLTKLKSTYVDALPALINPATGRVHTSYNQTGAVTGRFSSNDPNLQNIPIRAEEGRRVRKAFIAQDGHVFLAVDYSQVELRILAHFSQDTALLEAFRQGLDIHRSTAAAVHRVSLDEVTYEQRSFAKSVNFGLMYGMGAFRLARDADMSRKDAQDFIDTYFERFPGVQQYLDESKELAREKGYVETLLGRRRYFPELLASSNAGHMQKQRAEREAINMPIQGTAADILKIAMINLHRELRAQDYRARMILQVHDELVLEVPEEELDEIFPLVRDTMESAYELDAPLRADANVGHNWYDMEHLD